MSLTLHVDVARWRDHQDRAAASYPGIVPVTKGNGYGFGNARLAAEATRLGGDTLAVGTYDELAEVRDAFPGDLLVLGPWRPGVRAVEDPRVVQTVSRLADLRELAVDDRPPRVVVELLTSIRRHGLEPGELTEAADLLDKVRCEGWALHLPLPDTRGTGAGRTAAGRTAAGRTEAERCLELLRAANLPVDRLWVSHVSAGEVAALGSANPGLQIRPRIGTALWLGDRGAYRVTARVLDVHPVRRDDRVGYRQRRVRGDGHLLVVSGGTAHGIALEAPNHVATVRDRARALASGGLEAAGRAMSPYTVAGRRRWFAEPPHMQVSLVLLPAGVPPPEVGDELDVNAGMTLTRFDEVVLA